MANKVITITDGSVTKTFTVPSATWDKMADLYQRWGNTLADTEAEITLVAEKLNRELTTLANKEQAITGGTGATKFTAGSVTNG